MTPELTNRIINNILKKHHSDDSAVVIMVAKNHTSGWDIKRKDEPEPLFTIAKKEDAIAYAIAICRNHSAELHIMDTKGRVVEKKKF